MTEVESTDKKRPLVFSADPAFAQLKNEGVVYSFRMSEKKLGPVWIRRSRTGEKEFDAEITGKRYVAFPEELREPSPYSGFDNHSQWVSKIKEYHDGFRPGYVYRVEADAKEKTGDNTE